VAHIARLQWREIKICEGSTARFAKVGWGQWCNKDGPEF